jgi:hypothetical protein
MVYKLKGIWAKVSVEWRYKAPEGGGDTHFSIMRGSGCDLVIKQTAEEKFIPTLYAENIQGMKIDEFSAKLDEVLKSLPYGGLTSEKVNEKVIRINIPANLRVGHEEHFGQVSSKFFEYLKAGKLPEWEVPCMITKYYTTTSALKLARNSK